MTCRGHRHPRASQPISARAFADEFSELAARAGIAETCALDLSESLARRHAQDERAYADVDANKLYFRFAPAVLWLPEKNRRGLIAHELGHVLCRALPGGGTEADADAAAHRVLGIRVRYDCRWPGKGLQRTENGRKRKPPARGECVGCGMEASTHPDAGYSFNQCGDCLAVVCGQCHDQTSATLCPGCVLGRR